MMATAAAAGATSIFLLLCSSFLFFSFCLLNPYHLCVNLYVRSSGSRTKLAFNSSSFYH